MPLITRCSGSSHMRRGLVQQGRASCGINVASLQAFGGLALRHRERSSFLRKCRSFSPPATGLRRHRVSVEPRSAGTSGAHASQAENTSIVTADDHDEGELKLAKFGKKLAPISLEVITFLVRQR